MPGREKDGALLAFCENARGFGAMAGRALAAQRRCAMLGGSRECKVARRVKLCAPSSAKTLWRSGEAIPPEPPSFACPLWRAVSGRGVAVIPLVCPSEPQAAACGGQ
jgi:hypothetical protein